jgi:endonuclease YncB( thermonuclease family)
MIGTEGKVKKSAIKSPLAAKCRGVPGGVIAFFLAAGAAALASVSGASGGAASPAPACADAPDHLEQGDPGHFELGLVMSVNERLELNLEDGRLLRLAGLDPPRPTPLDPDLDIKSRDKVGDWLTGRQIWFRVVDGRNDRWGRLAVLAVAGAGEPGSPMLPVGRTVLEAGLARYGPEAPWPCGGDMLSAEASARAGLLGLWADPYYAVLAPANHGAFAEKAGTSVIVEGEVTGVDAGRYRSKLYFGPGRSRDFTVAVPQRAVKLFESAGLNLIALKGQKIRVRGLLDLRFGPQIEISNPGEVEVIKTVQGDGPTESSVRRR